MTPYYRRIIGIDMAVDRRSVAVARATYHEPDATFVVDQLELGSDRAVPEGPTDRLHQTVRALAPLIDQMVAVPTLVAMDAPLGWPSELSRALADHRAGQPLGVPILERDQLFVRRTDREVTERFGRASLSLRPLEVGADRIARTAQAALALLEAACPRGVVWWPGDPPPHVGIVETYPAATLSALRGERARGYKGAAGRDARAVLFDTLLELQGPGRFRVDPTMRSPCLATDHALDAVVCAIAGIDVAHGRARPPTAVDDALRREGWIWVRDP